MVVIVVVVVSGVSVSVSVTCYVLRGTSNSSFYVLRKYFVLKLKS